MFVNRKSIFFRDDCHITKKTHQNMRQYPQSFGMVLLAMACIIVLILADFSGILQRYIQSEQNVILEGALKKQAALSGVVAESKKGQSYFFVQTEEDVLLYVTIPYEYYDAENGVCTTWYPAGTTLYIEGSISLPDHARNPGGFDEALWLSSKKTGLVMNAERIRVLAEPAGIWQIVYRLHEGMEHVLYHELSKEQADLSMALLTGAKHRLHDDFYTMTQSMGIAHIFAVSGLHVGVIGSVAIGLFHSLGWMRSRISIAALAVGLSVYCMLAGLPASSLRAAGMILLSALAAMWYRPPNAMNYLAFLAMVLLLDNPFLLWNAGFQLSFGVTLSLLLFVKPIQKKLSFIPLDKLRSSIAVVLAAYLGSVPLTAWHFYTFSPISPVFNFILVPLVTAAVPLLLAGLFLSAVLPIGTGLFFAPAKAILWMLAEGTEFLYTVIGRVQWNIGRPDTIILLIYIVFLVLLWYRLNDISIMPSLKIQTAAISVFVVFIILFSIPAAPKQDELLYLDTGQGSCALLRTSTGEVVLFDTGAQKQELSSVLAWYGVNHVEAIILSHCDMDHISGLTRVMETVSIEHIFMEFAQMQRTSVQECLNQAKQKGIACHAVEGQRTLAFSQYSVSLAAFYDNSHTTNNTELAAILYYPKGAIAFPGDLALPAVQQFISQEDTITIWTVPHHGSRNSGSANLYKQLKQKGAQYAVISAGKENRYGHPHIEVLEWIDQSHILRYSTAEQGAILFLLSEL